MEYKIFNSIEDSQKENLCNCMNVYQNNFCIKNGEDTFTIDNPTHFRLSLTETQYQKYSKRLIDANIFFESTFYPRGYFKKQYENLYSIEISFMHEKKIPFIKLIEFGGSYGKIQIDSLEPCSISHSGGTSGKGWEDHAQNWNLVGCNTFSSPEKMKAIDYLIGLLINQ